VPLLRVDAHLDQLYVHGWFAMDCASTLPFDLMAMFMSSIPAELKALRMVQLMRLKKLARMLRAHRLLQIWQNRLNLSNTTVEIGKIFAIIVLTSHWMACIWGLAVTGRDDMPGYTPATPTWFYLVPATRTWKAKTQASSTRPWGSTSPAPTLPS
jgi:hypothetical protein